MTLPIFILLFAVLGLFWLLLTLPPKTGAALLTQAGPAILSGVGVLLLLLGRGALGLPLIFIGLSWWRRMRAPGPSNRESGRKSKVRSHYLEMELDHDTGEMNGRVLTGSMEGTMLSSMSRSALLSLLREITHDAESAALLESFLDRYHPDWRDHCEGSSSGEDSDRVGFQEMTRDEAYQILGLAPGASPEEIQKAWRRLVRAVHPDGGGSAFLTAKINAARDVLLHK